MSEKALPSVPARVVRWHPERVRLGQSLLPVAMLVGIMARRTGGTVLFAAAFATIGVALAILLGARRGFAGASVSVERGRIRLGPREPPIVASEVRRWAFDGATARIQGASVTWSIRASSADTPALGAALRSALGRPVLLTPRGSQPARRAAFVVGASGVLFVALALGLGLMPLFPVGLLCIIGGVTAFGALSQKVAAPVPRV